ncbi:MAG: CapA family protein [Peptostreptococcaceae bacterium]|nr:CapA family protein [Peptostreptococcaceae bacterium]
MEKLIMLLSLAILLTGCSSDAREIPFKDSALLVKIENETNLSTVSLEEGRKLWYEYEALIENRRIVLSATGDIMLGRRVGRLLDDNGGESAYRGFSTVFSRSDVLFGNLECSLSEKGQKLLEKGIWLRASPNKAELLKEAGFSILSLANNHILDYGNEALSDTIAFLEEEGIGHVGAGKDIEAARKPEIFKKGDTSIGFLAYNEFSYYFWSYQERRKFVAEKDVPGTAPMDLGPIIDDIKKLKSRVDLVAVSLHWGIEESNMETEEQRRVAHALIDAGADIIIGHHPHVLQGLEIYRGRPILYSLGNYIFDQNNENNKQGMVAEIEIVRGNLTSLSLHPLYVKDKSEPIVPEGEKLREIMDKISLLSKDMGTVLEEKEKSLSYSFSCQQ